MVRTTVVIPNYNGMAYVDHCLSTLLKSTVPIAVILVDNGSADGSNDYVREHFPSVKMIAFPENRGFSAAVNAGITAAETEYVFLLNNDTEITPTCVQRLEEQMGRHSGCFSVQAKMVALRDHEKLDGAGDFYCALGWAYARGKDRNPSAYRKNDRIFSACAGAAIYRKSVFEQIGLFDEAHFAYLEDVDVGYRARLHGFENRFAAEAIVYHAGSAVSGSRHNAFKVRLAARNNLYLIAKNMPILQILLNSPLLLAGILVKLAYFAKKGLGSAYFGGLLQGFALAFSKEGRTKRVRLGMKGLPVYCKIEVELLYNVVRRFCG